MAHTSTAAESKRYPMVLTRSIASIALASIAIGCGDDASSSSPSAPSSTPPAATSVNVTVTSPIRMGQTAQASATAALSNGQSQNVTTGWRTDAVGVASVTDAGLVTAVANGQATIYVIAGGRQGQQVIRVVPDYHGEWEGTIRVTSCAQTGVFADLRLCSEVPVNSTEGFDLSLVQTGEAMNARMYLGESEQTVTAPVAPDGSSTFAGSASFTEDGVTLTFDSTWQINSTRVGALTGTVNDVFRVSGYPGEGRIAYEIQSATRTATSVRAQQARARRAPMMQGLGRRLRLTR